mgnify:CR=1 FL=1
MDLFNYENGVALPSEHAYLVSPYKNILERDESKSKEYAIRELTYIELVCSFKKSNPFSGYSDDIRPFKVAEEVFKNPSYEPDDLIKEGIIKYKKFQNEAAPSLRFYQAVKEATEKLISFFETVNFNERSKLGVAVYKPSDITKAVGEATAVLNNLNTLKEKVQQELYESSKTRGARDIGEFEK